MIKYKKELFTISITTCELLI